MLHLDPSTAVARFRTILDHPVAGGPTETAVTYLEELFVASGAAGVDLAVDGLSSGRGSVHWLHGWRRPRGDRTRPLVCRLAQPG